MASVYKEFVINVPPERAWAAIRDYGAAQRLVPDLLADCRLEGDARVVTFKDGRVAREILVDINDDRWRLVYAEPGGRFTTRSASVQVIADGANRCRVVWINDVLPNEFALLIDANMEKGGASMKKTLEGSSKG